MTAPGPERRPVHPLRNVLIAGYLATVVIAWAATGGGLFWPAFSLPIVGLVVLIDDRRRALSPARERELLDRVRLLSRTRSGALDVQAAELRRVERDLHDGAQARIVALAMSVGLAKEMLAADPAAAAALLTEAQATAVSALADLRTVMAGIQPPVLSDRGLVGAVQALALDVGLPVSVTATLAGTVPDPVASAVYFAVSECLTNVLKHSNASKAQVLIGYRTGLLTVVVTDNGSGGADFARGTGLRGVLRRLEAFDGTITLASPAGGPTEVTLEVPCALSSLKTSPSPGTA